MTHFGQIVDCFASQDQQWITVWDLEERRKWSIALARDAAFAIGDLVQYDKSATGVREISTIGFDVLPEGLVPLVEVPQTA